MKQTSTVSTEGNKEIKAQPTGCIKKKFVENYRGGSSHFGHVEQRAVHSATFQLSYKPLQSPIDKGLKSGTEKKKTKALYVELTTKKVRFAFFGPPNGTLSL
ncbi:hypothetical protein D3C80_1809180 [compost metagenome]